MKRNKLSYLIAGVALSAMSFIASADSFSGKIVGHHCAHEGTTCPVDKLDPHITLERDFVLVSGDNYYFLPNLPRDVKVRHVLDDVVIAGEVEGKYNAITVDKLTVKGASRSAWSAAAQESAAREFAYFDMDRNR